MSEEHKCECKMGKTYNSEDPECIRCKNAEKLFYFMLDRAFEKALVEGNTSELFKILDAIDK